MPTLIRLIDGLWSRVGPYVVRMIPDPATLVRPMPAHWKVVEAPRRCDGRPARAGLASDIGRSGATLIKTLERFAPELYCRSRRARPGG